MDFIELSGVNWPPESLWVLSIVAALILVWIIVEANTRRKG